MPLQERRVTDAAALKALAHPLRISLFEALVLRGPMTASQLGRFLDESPSNCSWHLRKLAQHGFVREAPGGSGRNRPWQAVSEGLTWGEEDDPAVNAAGDALTDLMLERELQRLRAARAARAQEPKEWRDATGLNQSALWMTAEEAADLLRRMRELFLTYVERVSDPDARPADARLVHLVGWAVPSGPSEPFEPAASPAPHETGDDAAAPQEEPQC